MHGVEGRELGGVKRTVDRRSECTHVNLDAEQRLKTLVHLGQREEAIATRVGIGEEALALLHVCRLVRDRQLPDESLHGQIG